jgi:hypothetical protein
MEPTPTHMYAAYLKHANEAGKLYSKLRKAQKAVDDYEAKAITTFGSSEEATERLKNHPELRWVYAVLKGTRDGYQAQLHVEIAMANMYKA